MVVFLDYQNVYMRARECFCWGSRNHADGQVNPLRLGLKLKGLADGTRELAGVRIYRGMPSNRHSPKGYAAAQRQIGIWNNQGLVQTFTRDLNYRDPSNPREKGIDVALAVDFVTLAVKGEYDVGVLFSGDTDLLPALEAVASLPEDGRPKIEVASWMGKHASSVQQLRLDASFGVEMKCHVLKEKDYGHVHDPTDYTRKRRRR